MEFNYNPTKIKVFGVGGAGCNAVNRMVDDEITDVDFYVTNTDSQVLRVSKAENKILLGKNTTGGLGCGGNPEIGRQAGEESIEEIKNAIGDADMVFIAAGEGGGTGTGAAPIVAKCAKDMGALTIAVVTKPFMFEGVRRLKQAIDGLRELKKNVDSIIVIPNDKLKDILGNIPLKDSFKEADSILSQAVQTISDLVSHDAMINLDFADVRTTMADKGVAMIGIGVDSGPNRATEAARKAVNSPLLETGIQGAKNAIINITGSSSLTVEEANTIVEYIRKASGNDLDTIFGVAINENLADAVIVTVIATGFDDPVSESVLTRAKLENKDIINTPVVKEEDVPKHEDEVETFSEPEEEEFSNYRFREDPFRL